MKDQRPRYDRELLLFGAKRETVLELWEVQRYGIDSYGDADYVSIYGLRPSEWHARGVRMLGRTAVECTRDRLADAIGQDVAGIAATCPDADRPFVVDPFAGSCNTLYWLLRRLAGARGVGFESDAQIFRLTQQNIAALDLSIGFQNIDYLSGLERVIVAPNDLLVAFIAPPWGDALEGTSGLDLRRTRPPVTEVVDILLQKFSHNRTLFTIQVVELVVPISLVELTARFDWSTLRIYELNVPGQNHGLIIGTKGWTPEAGKPVGGDQPRHLPPTAGCFIHRL